ncbi:MAG: acyl-CoA dehydrogenase family protein [Myxococcota bacterium]
MPNTQLEAAAPTEAKEYKMSNKPLEPAELIEAAEKLAPLLRAKAREAELARKPLDEVIDAIRDSGIFALMVPKCYGGHEADLDTFFEVALTLSRADASMGWLVAFYMEHSYWFCGFPEEFQKEVFAERPYVLAPVTLNITGGFAQEVEGGYRLSGQWSWGTGIIHAEWVLVGAMMAGADGTPAPIFFAVPRDEVEAIDTWYVSGMCSTGSFDIKIQDVFVPKSRTVAMMDLTNAVAAARLHDGPLYRTPLVPILGFASALSMLGAAQGALEEYQTQTKAKIASGQLRAGGTIKDEGKPSVVASAALTIDAAELLLRDVLRDVMEKRDSASPEERGTWITRMAHAVFMCRSAVQDIVSVTGASGSRLESPIQRALRDISTGSNHVIFDREARYADYGRTLLGQPIQSIMV